MPITLQTPFYWSDTHITDSIASVPASHLHLPALAIPKLWHIEYYRQENRVYSTCESRRGLRVDRKLKSHSGFLL